MAESREERTARISASVGRDMRGESAPKKKSESKTKAEKVSNGDNLGGMAGQAQSALQNRQAQLDAAEQRAN